MYDEVILDKAVQIAAKNGWDGDIERSGYAPLVFNKDFARHLWGSDLIDKQLVDNKDKSQPLYYPLSAWQYHIQQMAIAPDPIKYLGDNMP